MPELFTAEGRDTLPAQELIDAALAGKIIRVTHPVTVTGDLTLIGMPFSYAAWGSWMSLLGYLMLPVLLARILVVLKRQR